MGRKARAVHIVEFFWVREALCKDVYVTYEFKRYLPFHVPCILVCLVLCLVHMVNESFALSMSSTSAISQLKLIKS
jgi:hypothetical protein